MKGLEPSSFSYIRRTALPLSYRGQVPKSTEANHASVGRVRIYLTTLGSRGDHEPFRALAHEAARRGHEVHFAHTEDLPTDPSATYTEWKLPGSIEKWISQSGVSVIKALKINITAF